MLVEEGKSPICRTAFRSEHARREEMSSADFSDCRGTVTSSLLSYLFSLLHLVFYLFSSYCSFSVPPLTCPIPSFSCHSLLSSMMSLSLLSYFLLSGLRTENKWDTCQSKKASGGRGRCLGRGSAYYLFSPE